MDILNRINQLRRDRGWSIYRLADEAGLTQSTLSNMFARGTQPSISTLSALCDAFGITLSEFFDDGKTKSMDNTLLSLYHRLDPDKQSLVMQMLQSLNK